MARPRKVVAEAAKSQMTDQELEDQAIAALEGDEAEDTRPIVSADQLNDPEFVKQLREDNERRGASAAPKAKAPVAHPTRKFAKQLTSKPVKADEMVKVKIARRGRDKISTGYHEAILGDQFYAEGEVISLPRSAAIAYAIGQWEGVPLGQLAVDESGQEVEERGWVEILD